MSVPPASQTVSRSDFDAIASGFGDAISIGALKRGHLSRWILTLGSIIDAVGLEPLETALELLADAEEANPMAYGEVVTNPLIFAWAWTCLDGTYRPGASDIPRLVERINSVAAAAAIKCGVDFSIQVPVVAGRCVIPMVGCALVGEVDVAVVEQAGGRLEVRTDDVLISTEKRSADWQPIRSIKLSHNGYDLDVQIDDVDDFRHYWSPDKCSEYLTDDEFAKWSAALEEAWEIVVEHYVDYAPGIAATIGTIVPLVHSRYILLWSWHHAPGALGVTDPQDVHWLAFSLINGAQLVKLQLLQELVPVHHAMHDEYRFFAPWFVAPQSLREIFEGIYAHPAVATYWNKQRELLVDRMAHVDAELQFSRWRDRSLHSVDELRRSGDVTNWGHKVLDFVESSMRKMQVECFVDPAVRRRARLMESDFFISWRLRNLAPDHEIVQRLAKAWIAGVSCPSGLQVREMIRSGAPMKGFPARRVLATYKLAYPERWQALTVDEEELKRLAPDATPGDVASIDGDRDGAIEYFTSAISLDPDDREPWSGLAALHAHLPDPVSQSLYRRPEIIRAVHVELAHEHNWVADPLELASWLSPICGSHVEEDFVIDGSAHRPTL